MVAAAVSALQATAPGAGARQLRPSSRLGCLPISFVPKRQAPFPSNISHGVLLRQIVNQLAGWMSFLLRGDSLLHSFMS